MERCNIQNYKKILKLLEKVEINTYFAKCVISGYSDGCIIVDSNNKIQNFYIYNFCGMSFLFSEDKNFISKILNYNKNRNIKYEGVQLYPSKSVQHLHSLIRNNGLLYKDHTRLNFKFNHEKFDIINTVFNKSEMIKESAYNKILSGRVIPSMFCNIEHFNKSGIGYYTNENGKPTSWAFSAFIYENFLEIGVETIKNLQGNNLALINSAALIHYCIKNNIVPVWSCEKQNHGSFKLASRLGFEVSLQTKIIVINY